MKHLTFPLVLLSVLLTACGGSEVARLSFTQLSTEGNIHADSTVIHMTPDDELGLWCDFDVKYTGSGSLLYVIEAYAKDTLMGQYTLDPTHTNPTTGEFYTTLGNTTDISKTGKMNFFYVGEEDDYTIKAFVVGQGIVLEELEQLDLVLKK